MNRYLLPILTTLLILTACNSPPAVTLPTASPLPVSPTSTPLPATNTPPPAVPDPTEETIPQLSIQHTFEVIAAIQAHIFITEDWVSQETSLNERQAVLYPQVEYGIRPLHEIANHYLPADDLADQWHAASNFVDGYYLSTQAWAAGETPDEVYIPQLEADIAAFQEIIGQAISIAEDLGVDTAQYGPAFAGAIEAANSLLPELAVEPLPEAPAPGDLNPALHPVHITPFIFTFAGSEIFFTIGTIENASNFPQQNVEVEVAYFNFLDEHIGTVRGRLLADVAIPGGIYPFISTELVAGEEAALKDWTHYEVSAFSYPTAAESYQAFELVLSSTEKTSGEIILYGQITNSGGQTVDLSQVRIVTTAFNLTGDLVGVGDGFPTTSGSLPPGGSTTFELIIQAASEEPVSYQLYAEVAGE